MNLYDCISKDDISGATKLLEKGDNPNQLDEHGQTPLFRIVYNKTPRQMELLKLFIDSGANVNFERPDGTTPIFHAKGEIAELLLDNGAKIEKKSKNGSTPLHYSLDVDTIKIFLKAGLSINAKDDSLSTPLHTYVYFGSQLVEFAITNGADVNVKDKYGRTPLVCLAMTEGADENDNNDIIKTAQILIDAGADINSIDSEKKGAIDHAIENDNSMLADWLRF